MSDQISPDILKLTATIVSAHVSSNKLTTDALPGLIQSVYQSLSTIGNDNVTANGAEPAMAPAVPVKKSVFPDYIVCLEDGKKLTMLKRYLLTRYGLSPDAYRAKWGLPASYPMVAPSYAAHRSSLAKSNGLGRKPGDRPSRAEPQVVKGPARRARGSRG